MNKLDLNIKNIIESAKEFFPDEVVLEKIINNLIKMGYTFNEKNNYFDNNYLVSPTQGNSPPQVKKTGTLGQVNIKDLSSVQYKRTFKKLAKQYKRVLNKVYAPITIDIKGRIVNGHHRYDALLLQNKNNIIVRMIQIKVEDLYKENLKGQHVDFKKFLKKNRGTNYNEDINKNINKLPVLKILS